MKCQNSKIAHQHLISQAVSARPPQRGGRQGHIWRLGQTPSHRWSTLKSEEEFSRKKRKEKGREYKNKKAWRSSLRKRKWFCFPHSAMGRSRGGFLKKHLKNYNRDHTHWNNNDATYTQLLPSHMFSKNYNKHFSVPYTAPLRLLKIMSFFVRKKKKNNQILRVFRERVRVNTPTEERPKADSPKDFKREKGK